MAQSACPPRSAQQHRLAGREAARGRDHGGADPLAAVVEAEAAGEEPVAVRVVDDHSGADPGHRHAAGHHLGPGLEVGARVADHCRLAVRAAGGVDAHDLISRDRQQAERVVLAQVRLATEWKPGEVVDGPDLSRIADAGVREAGGERRLTLNGQRDRRAQTLQLELAEPLTRSRLDRVPDRLVRRCAGAHSSAPRDFGPARGSGGSRPAPWRRSPCTAGRRRAAPRRRGARAGWRPR